MKPKSYRRGYPVAILIGIEQNHAAIWQIFSQVAKPQKTILLNGDRKDTKALYTFHESIINELRPILKEGVRSIITVSPPKTSYAQQFLSHIKEHYTWLVHGPNKTTFSTLTGSASTTSQVAALTKTTDFKQIIDETTTKESENLLELLEKRLNKNDNLVFFSLEEAENLILSQPAASKPKPEYLLITDKYLSSSRQKGRLNRLTQIAANRKVKTRIVNAESPAGIRLTQLGGIVCLAKLD